mmetsp:Transcript_6091/g.7686  ORF Transcript_6091/g.7686 Transcript_6091/m.7686 type:complete len:401 (-) Transcript_6091:1408-2610(-)|eukprot:CAMPEP_0204841248 /NCGR_PEP_ID=MMETSP1346-20131115/41339_1 /ASSEMBLY_ACC=CAM_ASM_000771 /TAXON_ID=215587 /ORGANISM="Aplanochytrium stocchinoi, Strain GSBS06" /LENGTH=400 /DNA_ID=CAMNT_0051979271 /DNA_START=467 /DNA_END=1669 /DNA_ORIENTATION=-
MASSGEMCSDDACQTMMTKIADALEQQRQASETLLKALKHVCSVADQSEKAHKELPAMKKLKKLLKRIVDITSKEENENQKEIKKCTLQAQTVIAKIEERKEKEKERVRENEKEQEKDKSMPKKSGEESKTNTIANASTAPIKKAVLSMAGFDDLLNLLKRNEGNAENLLTVLNYLRTYEVKRSKLEATGAGKYVNGFKKNKNKHVAFAAKKVVDAWRECILSAENNVKNNTSKEVLKPSKASKDGKFVRKAENSKFARVTKEESSKFARVTKDENSNITRAAKGSEDKGREKEKSRKRGRSKSTELSKSRERENYRREYQKSRERSRSPSTKERRRDRGRYGDDRRREKGKSDADRNEEDFDTWMKKKRAALRNGFERVQAEEEYSAHVGDEDDKNAIL